MTERAFIVDDELIQRKIAKSHGREQYFACGPHREKFLRAAHRMCALRRPLLQCTDEIDAKASLESAGQLGMMRAELARV